MASPFASYPVQTRVVHELLNLQSYSCRRSLHMDFDRIALVEPSVLVRSNGTHVTDATVQMALDNIGSNKRQRTG